MKQMKNARNKHNLTKIYIEQEEELNGREVDGLHKFFQ